MTCHQSKIEQLIYEICPNGVGFKQLGELGDFYGGLSGKSKGDFSNGNAKFVTYMNIYSNIAVNTDINTFVKIDKNESQNKIEYGDVLFTGSSETPDECGMSSVLTKKPDDLLYLNSFCFGFRFHNANLFLPEFSKYLFRDEQMRKQIAKTANGVTRFNVSKKRFAKMTIPLPPLAIQKEIVKILNSFTALEAELEAELEARQKQYEYYRDTLLNFGDEVERETLGRIAGYRRGSFPQPYGESRWYGGENAMPFVQVADVGENMQLVENTKQKISKLAQPKSVFVPSGTVIVTLQGSIGRVAITQYDSYLDRTLAIFESFKIEIDKKYFAYQLERKFSVEKETARGSTIKTITKEEFTKFEIPVPPLAEQKRIVTILDKFDALVNDISIGLPAELSARRSQYEYYREKLLTFNKYAK